MKRFTRRKEDFTCEHCGLEIKGSGYTNHCPRCLWSKHVDVNPGDRSSECGGMMEVIRIEAHRDKIIIHHKCVRCGIEKTITASEKDDKKLLDKLMI